MVVEQDVSVTFGCRVRSRSSGPVVMVWYVLLFLEPPGLWALPVSNLLVLRIEAHKTIKVSHDLWGPASSGKEGLKKGLMSYYMLYLNKAFFKKC